MPGRSALEVLAVFTRLGLTSFGGPVAHLGYFRREFVERRGWLSEAAFADLLALCQFLPGPASSQAGFAIGLQRAGVMGGLAAFVGFTTPSALLMFAAAAGLLALPMLAGMAITHGLMLVAVAVVAHAVVGMARNLCRDWGTALIALAAAAMLLVAATPWMQSVVIAAGAFAGTLLPGATTPVEAVAVAPVDRRTTIGAAVLFALLLAGLPLLAAASQQPAIHLADGFFRSGALVFGGGHVVLPLLETETVGRGWIDESSFLAGYGAAQALPGPLFSFAAFLGAASDTGLPAVVAGLIALVAIFLPGLLLVLAVLPYWDALRRLPRAIHFIRGANASVVGVLAAALWRPVISSAIVRPEDAAVALAGFVALMLRAPNWLVVGVVATAGATLAWPR